ncbi:MAG: hypothetical protein GF398_17615, partial [Chitinivibrionales bacterium]|nr:hypothetical protein [Chitinivibrionales bacterium]
MRNALALFLALHFSRVFAVPVEEVALIVRTRGIVTVAYGQGRKKLVVDKGYIALPGAHLQTGRRGFAEILLVRSRSRFFMHSNSEAAIILARQEGKFKETVQLRFGTIAGTITAPKSAVCQLTTPLTIIDAPKG